MNGTRKPRVETATAAEIFRRLQAGIGTVFIGGQNTMKIREMQCRNTLTGMMVAQSQQRNNYQKLPNRLPAVQECDATAAA